MTRDHKQLHPRREQDPLHRTVMCRYFIERNGKCPYGTPASMPTESSRFARSPRGSCRNACSRTASATSSSSTEPVTTAMAAATSTGPSTRSRRRTVPRCARPKTKSSRTSLRISCTWTSCEA
ncbi:hypothetical protein L596_018005 [Steinernema carpocapsae]|uniref:Uncharacterized protein n=1 Tax=Steinernema carpocapsae TaxID=34508 RepID=A0A4V6A1X7_STECR|nr:hypothetical protein L596_018005 [Steinernema carpocapsae]